jgi:hypothetical protein
MAQLKKIHGESLDASRRIHREFGYLIKRAYGGNRIAAKFLHDTLQSQLRTFTYLCHKSPELFEPIARKKTKWPGFLSQDADIALDNAVMIGKLKLGETAKKKPAESKK